MEDDNFVYLCVELVVRFNFAFSLMDRIVRVVSDAGLM